MSEHLTHENGTSAASPAGDPLAAATACAKRIEAAAEKVRKLSDSLTAARKERDAAIAEGDALVDATDGRPGVGAFVRDVISKAKPKPDSRKGR